MPRLVRDDGRRDALIALIGEAPGAVEERRGKPFVGPSGAVLARWWKKVGLQRRDLYITNTWPTRPPGNNLDAIPLGARADEIEKLHDRIACLTDLRLIVPAGNHALQAFTGKTGITKHRGSIYEYTDRKGRKIKVVPTLHPASVFRNAKWERNCILDWQRIAEEVKFPELRIPKREHFIMPTLRDVKEFVDEARTSKKTLAIDIETPIEFKYKVVGHTKKGTPKRKKIRGDRFIACVGFAISPKFSITIPTTKAYWKSQATLDRIWDLIGELCLLPNEKVFHNGWFDTWHLARKGITVRNWKYDTLAMSHALVPNASHSLAQCASVDTREPYWKDEGKSEDKGVPIDLNTWWTYNGRDCCATWELHRTYMRRLEAEGKAAYYRDHYQKLFRPVLQMMIEGIRTDEAVRTQRFAELTATVDRIRRRLRKRTGMELYGAKGGLSPTKLKHLLYEKLGLPTKLKKNTRGEYVATTNEVAVRQLMIRHPKVLKKIGPLILDNRRLAKLREFYAEKLCDADGRFRSAFSFIPENGRFSSSKNPMGTGGNAQNIDRDARDQFIPDEGHVFVRRDLSQAESRLVYMMTRDRDLIQRARSMPWEYDDHVDVASIIFDLVVAELNDALANGDKTAKEQRYFGKRVNHAKSYGLMGKKGAEEILKDGYVISGEEFQSMIDKVMAARPAIGDVFHAETRRTVITDKKMSNTWGRTLDFTMQRITPEVFRQCYAFRAASEVSGIINQFGIRPFWRKYKHSPVRLRNQVHDELIVSTPPELAWEVSEFLRVSLERERVYCGNTLTIPSTVKVGMSWGAGHEWQKPPKRSEFEDVVFGLVKDNVQAHTG